MKMKPIDIKINTCINVCVNHNDFGLKNNEKDPKCKNYARISQHKNIFTKCYTSNWSEEVSVIKKVKSTVPWKYAIEDLNGEEIVGMFYEKELQANFRIEKVIKKKGDKLYVKWKGYTNLFNSWIDKKHIVNTI